MSLSGKAFRSSLSQHLSSREYSPQVISKWDLKIVFYILVISTRVSRQLEEDKEATLSIFNFRTKRLTHM